MQRLYIERDTARITLQDNGYRLDVALSTGETFSNLEARRLFPVTGGDRYITLLDESRNEVALIRDVNNLAADSRAAVMAALTQFYLVPKIHAISRIYEKAGALHVTAETDHGTCQFEIKSRSHNVKVLPDGRVFIRDSNDNRYEIPDQRVLDRKSRNELLL